MVLQQVADHQGPLRVGSECGELPCLGDVQRQRLLDEDVLASDECGAAEVGVGGSRGGDDHRIDLRVRKHLVPASRAGVAALRKLAGQRRIGIDDRRQRTQLVEVADKVLPPVAAAGDSDPRGVLT